MRLERGSIVPAFFCADCAHRAASPQVLLDRLHARVFFAGEPETMTHDDDA